MALACNCGYPKAPVQKWENGSVLNVRHAVGFSLEAAIVLIRETLLKKVRCDGKELHKAFRVFDRDGNGEVDAKEFGQALLREVGLKFEPDLLAQIIARLDKDGNGTVGFDEFFRYIMGTAVQDLLKFKDAYAKESAEVNPLDDVRRRV